VNGKKGEKEVGCLVHLVMFERMGKKEERLKAKQQNEGEAKISPCPCPLRKGVIKGKEG
jgi:hypothetical protein